MDFPFFLVVIIIMGIVGYFTYQNEERKKEAWKRFAASHNLTFIPGSFPFGNTSVYGRYRGHSLELDTCNRNKRTYTRLILYPNSLTTGNVPTNLKKPNKPEAREIVAMVAPRGLPISIKVAPYGSPVSYEQEGILTDTQSLVHFSNFLSDIADRYQDVLALGGEAVPALQDIAAQDGHPLRAVAGQLLKDIADLTSRRFSHQLDRFLCPHCLTRFGEHQIQLHWWQSISYYGCRTCGQSRETLENDGWAVAVLDSQMAGSQLEQNKIIRVNWLGRRSLFDFDEIEIVHATDEEVERFAVQVGNDTDPFRQPRYKQMRCRIAANCHLTENTQRILERTFGQVEMTEITGALPKGMSQRLQSEPETSAAERRQRSRTAEEQETQPGDEASAGEDQDDLQLDLTPLFKHRESSHQGD